MKMFSDLQLDASSDVISLLQLGNAMGSQLTGQGSLDSQASTSSTLSTSSSCGTTSRGAHKCLAILHGQSLHVTTLCLSGDVLYAGSNHGEIRAWEHPDMHEWAKFGCGEAAVKCVVVVGEKVISAHQDHKIRVWRRSTSQPQEHKLITTLPSVADYIANFLPAKNYVQVRRHHKSLWINHHDSISTLAVGNGVLYSGSWDKSVKVWRLTDFKCLESLNHHIDAVNALAVDTNNDLLYTGSADTTINVFHNKISSTKKKPHHVLLTTLESNSPVNALALCPDKSILYSGQSDKSVTVWKVRDDEAEDPKRTGSVWTAVGVLRGHRMSVLCVATMANLVISGSADKSVRVWRRGREDGGSVTHVCVSVMVGHAGPVKSLCVMEDMAMGAVVYSGGMDGDVRMWWIPEEEEEMGLGSEEDMAPDSPVLVNWRTSKGGICVKSV